MNFLYLLLLVPFVPVALIVWTTIHELSHFFMAKYLVNAKLVHLQVLPSRDPVAGFRWGYCQYQYPPGVTATPKQEAATLFAPRIPDVVAALCLPFAPFIGSLPAFVIWSLVFAPALFDLGNGSMGMSPYSDLSRGCADLGITKLWPRLIGWSVLLVSAASWIFLSIPSLKALFT